MFEQIRGDILFMMFYAVVAVLSLVASFYLLFRRGNAFAPDVTPPLALRRWAAMLLAAMALGHVWYMPIIYLKSEEDIMQNYLIGELLDSMIVFPLAIGVLFSMLQDRRRPLWPVVVTAILPAVIAAFTIPYGMRLCLMFINAYLLLLCIGLIAYMIREVRHYCHWLSDNYVDLEHKEVWQSFVVLFGLLVLLSSYVFSSDSLSSQYAMQVGNLVLIGYLLWRVETLSDLSIPDSSAQEDAGDALSPASEDKGLPQATINNISNLLQQYCIDTQLYLQHDLTLQQLAKAIGTNRFYLSRYFSDQGITYNVYINNLRINHFMKLYAEVTAAQRPYTAQQLASQSGYRSYSTFGLAFKQRMGQTVTAWMHNAK